MDNIPSDLPARNRHLTVEAGIALLFALLYFGLFLHMVWRYNRKDYKWRSKHTLLFSHVCIRVVSQALGVAFGILVFDNVDVFIAYLVLSADCLPRCIARCAANLNSGPPVPATGAEGYFTLVSQVPMESSSDINLTDTWFSRQLFRPSRPTSSSKAGIGNTLATPGWRSRLTTRTNRGSMCSRSSSCSHCGHPGDTETRLWTLCMPS